MPSSVFRQACTFAETRYLTYTIGQIVQSKRPSRAVIYTSIEIEARERTVTLPVEMSKEISLITTIIIFIINRNKIKRVTSVATHPICTKRHFTQRPHKKRTALNIFVFSTRHTCSLLSHYFVSQFILIKQFYGRSQNCECLSVRIKTIGSHWKDIYEIRNLKICV